MRNVIEYFAVSPLTVSKSACLVPDQDQTKEERKSENPGAGAG
jgi:hypothetical protein